MLIKLLRLSSVLLALFAAIVVFTGCCARENAYIDANLDYDAALIQFEGDEFRYTAGKYFLAREMGDSETARLLSGQDKWNSPFGASPFKGATEMTRILEIRKERLETPLDEELFGLVEKDYPNYSDFAEANIRFSDGEYIWDTYIMLGRNEDGQWRALPRRWPE